jgi:hypothetical protein
MPKDLSLVPTGHRRIGGKDMEGHDLGAEMPSDDANANKKYPSPRPIAAKPAPIGSLNEVGSKGNDHSRVQRARRG